MTKDDRETVRGALSPRLEGAFSRLLAAARAEGFAAARERAAAIADNYPDGPDTASSCAAAIRAMQDGAGAVDGTWCSCRRAMREGPYGEECPGCGRPENLCDCDKVSP